MQITLEQKLHLYERSHQAHAWKYASTTPSEATAEKVRKANNLIGVETLLVPGDFPPVQFLDSCQTQGDFPRITGAFNKAIVAFTIAAGNLAEAWAQVDHTGDYYATDYPFACGFDELVRQIIQWRDTCLRAEGK